MIMKKLAYFLSTVLLCCPCALHAQMEDQEYDDDSVVETNDEGNEEEITMPESMSDAELDSLLILLIPK